MRSGSVIRHKVLKVPAPVTRAASSKVGSVIEADDMQ
jgi:hypothetical protein